MVKIFEWLGGLMFLVALIEFVPNPKKALEEAHAVLVSPSPRIVNGHLVLPRNQTKNAKAERAKTETASGKSSRN